MTKGKTEKVVLTADTANAIYEAALQPKRSALMRVLSAVWLVVGVGGLVWFAWSEPFSGWLFEKLAAAGVAGWIISYVLQPLVMAVRAVIAVESIGYAYHRFFQHVGFFTRRAQVFRRNQRFHWIHHMIIYPIGRLYKHGKKYVPSEKGVGLSWVVPGLLAAGLFLFTHGFNVASFAFIFALWAYAKLIVDETHARFHFDNHSWVNKPYFNWLEEIHLLHHWDQRTNFTIVHPLMDQLFGTYLDPKKHRKELEICLEDKDLTVSDLINYRYLLVEASPAEYAAYISAAKRFPKSLTKAKKLVELLDARVASHPEDAQAADLHSKALALVTAVGKASEAA
ncbi:MAG TPA: sterol desaturase family protein [Candidatus Obscuribacterales bacterium]